MDESPPCYLREAMHLDQSAIPPTIVNQHRVHQCGWHCKFRSAVVSTSSETRNWAQCGRWQGSPSWRTEVVAIGFESCSMTGVGGSYGEPSGYTCIQHRWWIILVLRIILYILVLQVFTCKNIYWIKKSIVKCPSKVYQTDVQDLEL